MASKLGYKIILISSIILATVSSNEDFAESDVESDVGGDFHERYERATQDTDDVYLRNPWQVCVSYNGGDSSIKQICHCGGILIKNQWILSAAHCFRSSNANQPWRKSQFQFVVGLSKSKKKLKAKNIIIHEGFKPDNNRCVPDDNDIALVQLEQPVVVDNQHIKVLKLPTSTSNFDGMSCEIGDWDGNRVPTLTDETVSVAAPSTSSSTSDDQCSCTKCSQNTQQTLQGDSGGAVACGDSEKYVAGIVQFAQGCNGAKAYVPVTSYSSWITSITG